MKKLIYSFFFLPVLFGSAVAQIPTSPSIYFPFCGNTNDLSGNNRNGTPNSGTTATYTTDRFGNANSAYLMNSNGTNWLSTSYSGVGGTGARTVNYWIKPNTYNVLEYPIIASYGTNAASADFRVGINFYSSQNISFDIAYNATSYKYPTSKTLYDGGWHMLTYVVPANATLGSIQIYYDGTQLTTLDKTCCNANYSSNAINTQIGTGAFTFTVGTYLHGTNSSNNYKGSLDDLRFYERALTSTEILALFNETSSSSVSTPTFLPIPTPNVCAGTSYNYAITTANNVDSYTWSVNGIIQAGVTGSSFNYTWPVSSILTNPNKVSVVANSTCFNSAQLTTNVNVAAVPSAPGAITGLASGFCSGTNVAIPYSVPQVTGVTSYVWSLGSTVIPNASSNSVYIPFTTAGSQTISVVAQSANGACNSAPTTLNVVANGAPQIVNIIGNDIVCPNSTSVSYSIQNPTAGTSYLWIVDNGVKTNFVNGISTNILVDFINTTLPVYKLSVTPVNGCGQGTITTKNVTIQTNAPVKPVISCIGASCSQLTFTDSDPATAVTWYVGGAPIANPTPRNILNTPTNQAVYVKFSKGSDSQGNSCINTSSSYPFGGAPCLVARQAAPEIQLPSESSYLIYPNPSSGSVTIETQGQVGVAYVFNTLGQEVASVDLNANNYIYTVNLAAKGLYTFKIKSNQDTKGYKVVVE